ncbi:late embryogenesis abundant protein [Wolffia australiana]
MFVSLRTAVSPPPSFSSLAAASRKMATVRCFSKEAKGPQEKAVETKDEAAESQPESFGVAYSTRCEEEGFGGVYAGPPPRPSHRESSHAADLPPSYEEMKEKKEQEHEEEEAEAPRSA